LPLLFLVTVNPFAFLPPPRVPLPWGTAAFFCFLFKQTCFFPFVRISFFHTFSPSSLFSPVKRFSFSSKRWVSVADTPISLGSKLWDPNLFPFFPPRMTWSVPSPTSAVTGVISRRPFSPISELEYTKNCSSATCTPLYPSLLMKNVFFCGNSYHPPCPVSPSAFTGFNITLLFT